eukprot:g4061.t1
MAPLKIWQAHPKPLTGRALRSDWWPFMMNRRSQALMEFPSIVHLNIGGQRLTTTLATLRAEPDSMLGLMFSGKHPVLRDADGCYFIDRDGRQFHHILNYLRDGTLPIGLLDQLAEKKRQHKSSESKSSG